MRSSPKVLILTGSYGSGHLEVTRALIEQLKKRGITDVVTSDLFYEAHPILTKFTKYLYIKSFSKGKRIYGFFYYNSDSRLTEYRIDRIIDTYGYMRLNQIMKNNNFDVVINTFPMQVFPIYKKKSGQKIPFVNVLTDFCLHTRWVSHEIDHYFVSCEGLKEELENVGISRKKITISGIPIKEQFYQQRGKKQYDLFQLDREKKTVLISAGTFGVLTNIPDIVSSIKERLNTQVVVVCGKNKALYETLEKQFQDDSNVHIFGFVTEMAALMTLADVMVTKPGGISLSEAIAVKVPLVLTPAVPGQERDNANLFEREGMAIKTNQEEDITPAIIQLLNQPSLRNNLIGNLEKNFHPHAANQIIEQTLELAGITEKGSIRS
ncbi:glycosyltransferase [Bacillaceae bacterium Marseille-Q3522]|nr:glycosyltransferase [Bacillaceae bacterium Marseille-Q3522]